MLDEMLEDAAHDLLVDDDVLHGDRDDHLVGDVAAEDVVQAYAMGCAEGEDSLDLLLAG